MPGGKRLDEALRAAIAAERPKPPMRVLVPKAIGVSIGRFLIGATYAVAVWCVLALLGRPW